MCEQCQVLIKQRDGLQRRLAAVKRRLQCWEGAGRLANDRRKELAEAVQYDLGLTVDQAERLLKRLEGGAWSGALEREFPELRRLLAEARDLARIRGLGRIIIASRQGGQVRWLLDAYSAPAAAGGGS